MRHRGSRRLRDDSFKFGNQYQQPVPATSTSNQYQQPVPATSTSNQYQQPVPATSPALAPVLTSVHNQIMPSNRRDFLQASASAAAALTLSPLTQGVVAETLSKARRENTLGAEARAIEEKVVRARPVHLSKVRVLGGPLKAAQDATAKYLLELEPDRMMAYYRVRAGLPQKAQPYGGWDGGGRNLTGHIAGHHLSAVSLMWAATGDARFRDRAGYIVRELKEVQDKNGDGYLSALEGLREAFAALSKGD